MSFPVASPPPPPHHNHHNHRVTTSQPTHLPQRPFFFFFVFLFFSFQLRTWKNPDFQSSIFKLQSFNSNPNFSSIFRTRNFDVQCSSIPHSTTRPLRFCFFTVLQLRPSNIDFKFHGTPNFEPKLQNSHSHFEFRTFNPDLKGPFSNFEHILEVLGLAHPPVFSLPMSSECSIFCIYEEPVVWVQLVSAFLLTCSRTTLQRDSCCH